MTLPSLSDIATYSTFVFVGIVAIAQWRIGRASRRVSDENDASLTIKLKDAAIDALKLELSRINTLVIQQGKDIATLQTQLASEKDLNGKYLELLQNRNPELEIFMKNVLASTEVFKEYIKVNTQRMEVVVASLKKLLENDKLTIDP